MMTSSAIFHSLGVYAFTRPVPHTLTSSSLRRSREEELIYVLRQLSELRLWEGTLASTAQDEVPSLKELSRRGDKAHLFYFYDLLVDVACSPRRAPTAWRISTEESGEGKLMEVDARRLAKKCLKVLGGEICTVP
jgi:hypothetical protein